MVLACGTSHGIDDAGPAGDAGSDATLPLDAHLPVDAGGPHEMTVSNVKTTATYKDVLIGEVWFCSGQSNMVVPVSF